MSAPKLTTADLIVIVDTLRGSLRIADNGYLFEYSEAIRRYVADKLLAIVDDVKVEIT